MSVQRVGDLDIGQDLQFQRRSWLLQRIAWAAGVALLAVAALGFLGDGPVARTTIRHPRAGVELEYQRFARHRAPAILSVLVEGSAVEDGKVRLWFDATWFAGVSIESVFPEPAEVTATGDRFEYEFQVDPATGANITFNVLHEAVGARQGRLGVGEVEVIEFSQFVYP